MCAGEFEIACGVQLEDYGYRSDDPTKLRTDIFYLLS